MNGLSRKLYELDKNELELPEDDEIFLHIGDADEIELHNQAQTIRGTVRAEAEEIINNTDLTVEQQNELSKQLLSRLTERERAILEQSGNFIEYRLKRLLYKQLSKVRRCGAVEKYIVKEAKNKKDAKSLLEDGFEYVMDKGGVSLFRKLK